MQYFDCDKIQFEGPDSKNPLAFKHYNADEVIAGKTMKEHLRFAGAYWHVMRNDLSDPFGADTALMPWDDGSDSVENALTRVDVFFEFLDKMGIEYYCWHDRDIAPELNDLSASNDALDQVVAKLKEKQAETGVSFSGVRRVFSLTRVTRRVRQLLPTPTSMPTPVPR